MNNTNQNFSFKLKFVKTFNILVYEFDFHLNKQVILGNQT